MEGTPKANELIEAVLMCVHTSRYTIVSSYEADPAPGRISNESPVGKALLGRKAGDQVVAAAPGRVKAYTILGIE